VIEYRQSKGLTRRELAAELSTSDKQITAQQVSNWELGRTSVPGDVVLAIIGQAK
jgi:transcriptional regulator with XRE-family HTH domain